MGTWVKETDRAIYLMEGGGYLDRVVKTPSPTNELEKVADITPLPTWFARPDRPRAMTVSIGTGAPEPEPIAPPPPGEGKIPHNGQLMVVAATFFKLSTQSASDLPSEQKVFVNAGSVFAFRSYTDVGSYHWRFDFLEPVGDTNLYIWYVFTPHMRLGTDAILNVTADTIFKQQPIASTELPPAEKAGVKAGTQFTLASFLPAENDHTQVELADVTLAPNNDSVWYVYNPHFTAIADDGSSSEHPGLQIRVVNDTYFTLTPDAPENLPDAQKVQVSAGAIVDIQYYVATSDTHWRVELADSTLGNGQTAWYVTTADTALLSPITLTTQVDTIFKREPKPSLELPPTEKVSVPAETQYQLINHVPAAGDHTQVELADAALGPNGETRWYVYNPHVAIAGQRELLRIVGDTVFKTSTAAASELPDEQKFAVGENTVFELVTYDQPENNHIKVVLKGAKLGPDERDTWYCYVPHIWIVGTEMGNNPDDDNPGGGGPPEGGDRGIPLQFPGFEGTYYSNDPIFWQTEEGDRGHFTWGQALHVNPNTGSYRPPENAGVIYGIQRIAQAMESIYRRYGVDILVTSWYRDPATNAAVGGSSQSRHMTGDAVDFYVPGVHPYDVYADLDGWWGSQGGLASSTTFIHIDARGYYARWDYGDAYYARRAETRMGTWVKHTDVAIYLMTGNAWVSRLLKSPSTTNPAEQVVDINPMAEWFSQANPPRAMTIAIGTGAPEPEEWQGSIPPSSGQTNDAGVEIIKHFEGLRTTAYLDPVGIWTIGYGHTSAAGPPEVYPGLTITAAEAEVILRRDLNLFEQGVNDALTIATNEDQFSAMVSFSFNVGLGAFRDSTLLYKHNRADFAGAAEEFRRWVYAGGEVLPGLVRRREAERALYLSEDYTQFLRQAAAPTTPEPQSNRGRRVAAVLAATAASIGLLWGGNHLAERANAPSASPAETPEAVEGNGAE